VNSGAGTASAALRASEALRSAGFDVLMHAGGGSFKSQFRRADASGARIAVVIGEDELARGEVGVKPLRGGAGGEGQAVAPEKGAQQSVPMDRLAETVAELLLGGD
jgi:histidyl-tRNA synthetase